MTSFQEAWIFITPYDEQQINQSQVKEKFHDLNLKISIFNPVSIIVFQNIKNLVQIFFGYYPENLT